MNIGRWYVHHAMHTAERGVVWLCVNPTCQSCYGSLCGRNYRDPDQWPFRIHPRFWQRSMTSAIRQAIEWAGRRHRGDLKRQQQDAIAAELTEEIGSIIAEMSP